MLMGGVVAHRFWQMLGGLTPKLCTSSSLESWSLGMRFVSQGLTEEGDRSTPPS